MSKSVQQLAEEGKKAIILVRVSSSNQVAGMPAQEEYLKSWARQMGFKGRLTIFSEAGSGKKADRANINEMFKFLQSRKNPSDYVIIVRDVERWARDVLLGRSRQLRLHTDFNVDLIVVGLHQVIGPDGTYANDMVFEIMLAIAENAKKSEEEARDVGTKRAKKKGLFDGAPLESYPKAKKSPVAYIARQVPRLIAEDITQGTIVKKVKAMGGGGSFWVRGRIGFFKELLSTGGQQLLDEWVEVFEARRAFEKRYGSVVGKKSRGRKQKALHRVTVAYLRDPILWPNPLTDGNPQTATNDDNPGPGTIQDAIRNAGRYQPPKV